MSVSFEEIGQVLVTCKTEGEVAQGAVVKLCGDGTVGPCQKGEAFAGVAVGVAEDGYASVQVKGFVETACSSDVSVGWNSLCGDGQGGVEQASADGVQVLVWSVEDGVAVLCL